MLVGPMFSGACKSESRREKLKAKLQKNTPLEDDIHVNGTMVHIVYALKMGEKYRKRYRRHFRNPDIHEFDTVPRLKSLI